MSWNSGGYRCSLSLVSVQASNCIPPPVHLKKSFLDKYYLLEWTRSVLYQENQRVVWAPPCFTFPFWGCRLSGDGSALTTIVNHFSNLHCCQWWEWNWNGRKKWFQICALPIKISVPCNSKSNKTVSLPKSTRPDFLLWKTHLDKCWWKIFLETTNATTTDRPEGHLVFIQHKRQQIFILNSILL